MSGSLAALGGVVGKLSLSEDSHMIFLSQLLCFDFFGSPLLTEGGGSFSTASLSPQERLVLHKKENDRGVLENRYGMNSVSVDNGSQSYGDELCSNVVPILCRGVGFGCMLYINALMLSTFLKALGRSDHSLKVVVLNSAANFITTGVLGFFVFGESVSMKWVMGAAVISVGICLISMSAGQAEKVKNEDEVNPDFSVHEDSILN